MISLGIFDRFIETVLRNAIEKRTDYKVIAMFSTKDRAQVSGGIDVCVGVVLAARDGHDRTMKCTILPNG